MKFDLRTILMIIAVCGHFITAGVAVVSFNNNIEVLKINTSQTVKEVKKLRQEINQQEMADAVFSTRLEHVEKDIQVLYGRK